MGAQVSISPPLNMQTVYIKKLLSNKKAMHELFAGVVIHSRPQSNRNRQRMNDKLAIEEVLLYFTKGVNPLMTKNFVCNSLW